jgi:LPXTG-motif cell wall-anchored protein
VVTRRLRVEIIRFGLLLTMTIALVSVATRHNDHSSGRNEAARGHQPSATATPASGGTTAQSSLAPSPGTTSSSPSPAAGSGGNDGASDTSEPGQVGSVPTLPRTGGTQTVDLAALAALFIAAGSFGMRISRPRTTQAGESAAAALAQAGHAVESSGSNRPGTV